MTIVAFLAVLVLPAAPVHAQAGGATSSVSDADASASADKSSSLESAITESIAQPKSALHMIIMLAVASLLPALILTCTCWVRFIIVFSFLRTGMGTQGAPPSQVLVGLSIFMTLFVMAPVAGQIYEEAAEPYFAGDMDEKQALVAAAPPLRRFMLENTREQDLELFYEVSSAPRPNVADDVPMKIVIPSFILSELTTAFKMGIVILLPFLVVELVVAALLSALGMIMLPPPIVSLPIKILVFVIVDGWHLVVGSLLRGAVG